MKVFLLIDTPQYESTIIVAAYADEGMAARRLERMQASLRRWQEAQRALDEAGSDDAYTTSPPHNYGDLSVFPMTVIPNTKHNGVSSVAGVRT